MTSALHPSRQTWDYNRKAKVFTGQQLLTPDEVQNTEEMSVWRSRSVLNISSHTRQCVFSVHGRTHARILKHKGGVYYGSGPVLHSLSHPDWTRTKCWAVKLPELTQKPDPGTQNTVHFIHLIILLIYSHFISLSDSHVRLLFRKRLHFTAGNEKMLNVNQYILSTPLLQVSLFQCAARR